ncbi:DMT family transporter [Natronosalvus caseinilyticus]|uniref:DMT family transporter n=1 Tax=Natronosalvus caseinilyticus TaxID=2953747 RepID=UPI0028A6725D|nr:EamA family transporter [Natronosalvus caseinilyticus]
MIDVYALALLTALLWGFTPILDKRGMLGGGTPLQASIVVVIVDSSVYWIAIAALSGSRTPFDGVSLRIVGLFVVAGFVGTALGRLSLFFGIDHLGASINNAVLSTRPLFATIVAVAFLGEAVSLKQAVGIVVIVVGLTILTTARGGDLEGWTSWHVVFPLVGAAAFGVSNVIRRYGLTESPVTALEAVALNETAGFVALAAYAMATQGRDIVDLPRRSAGYYAVSGLFTAAAFMALFEALDRGSVSIVDPLYGTAPLFTTVFGYFLLRDVERVTVGIVAGAATIVLGAVLVTTA